MKKLLRKLLALTCALSLVIPVWSQEVVMAMRHRTPTVTTTNIAFVSQFTANTSTSSTSLSQAYTCASTSNRLIIQAAYQNSTGSIALTDTGGQASGAAVIFASQSVNGVIQAAWNSGCASGSNTYTITETGGVATGIVIQFAEYSGITSGSGTWTSTNTGTSSTLTASGTPGTSHSLMVVFGGFSGTTNSFYTNITAGFNYRNVNIASGGNPAVNTTYPVFDNLNATGAQSFSATLQASHSGVGTVTVFIPGVTATSPGWYPYMVQSAGACSAPAVMHQNVTSGNLITVAFGSEATGNDPTSITDTLGTTYTLQVKKVISTTNAIWIYTGVPSSSGADTITANGSGFSSACTQAVEFNGPGQTTTDTDGQTTSSGSMTWTQTVGTANSIIYAACRGWHGGTTFSMTGAGFVATSQSNGADAIGGSWARTTSTSSQTPIFTVSTTDNNVCAGITVH